MTVTTDAQLELSADTEPPVARRRTGPNWSRIGGDYGVILFLLALIAFFALARPGIFLTPSNVFLVLGDLAIPGILALAAILPLMAGEFDLSIGATLGFTAITGALLSNAGLPFPAVVVVAVLIGAAVGAVNAILVTALKINAFIATLGVATLLTGGNLLVTGSAMVVIQSEEFGDLTAPRIAGIQIVTVYFLVIAVLLYLLVERTPWGRYTRATGMGRPAAILSGVRTNRFLTSSFVLAGALAALAGILFASRAGSVPPTLGPDFLLPAYAAAFLGATTIRPGYFNVWGTVVGVLLLAVGSNGLTLFGAQTWATNFFNGGALIVAVAVSGLLSRSRRAAAS